ncbi:MAG: protein kinase domain-containing protein [Lacipirellulaceae bacterium]
MANCPNCGAPASPDDERIGLCPACKFALPEVDLELPEPDEANGASPDSRTLRPAPLGLAESQTIEFAEGSAVLSDSTVSGEKLIKPRELSPEFARRVAAAWKQSKPPGRDLAATIKGERSGVADHATLNIVRRSIGPVTKPGPKDYELIEVIGEGAMGSVWRARQKSLDREVALKTPKDRAAETELGRQQFVSEVVVTGKLDHPNIVPIYDLAEDEKGQLFYAMKRVEGRPWNELLADGKRDLQQNLEILMKVCDAIRFAHDRRVIHRDIKPHNIMVGQYGEVSVMDWGIALQLGDRDKSPKDAKLSPAGTPAYMAPEMATGSVGEIGPVTDVYLLGAILYELLTGLPPHPPPTESDSKIELINEALMIAARNDIRPIGARSELVDIAYKALATEVSDRYQSVGELQDAIRAYFAHAESIALSDRGEALLTKARANGHSKGAEGSRFDDFDRARFAFDEALQIWPGNRFARKRLDETLLAYAEYAYQEGAYRRGVALLEESNPEQRPLRKKLRRAQRWTDSLSLLLKSAAALIVVGTLGFTYFLNEARQNEIAQREEAEAARVTADDERMKADAARVTAEDERMKADAARVTAEDERMKADAARVTAEDERMKADAARVTAEDQRKIADTARMAAVIARKKAVAAEREAERSSYAFEIGVASEELQRNAFDRARAVLASQAASEDKRELRGWEWGHLKALADRPVESFDNGGQPLGSRVEATAASPDGSLLAAGTVDGDVYLWRRDRGEQPVRLKYGAGVSAMAFADDGSLVVGGREEGGAHAVKSWRTPARDGDAPQRQVAVHEAPVLSLRVSPDGTTLASASADGVVRLSGLASEATSDDFVATPQENAIWSVDFSRDGQWIATAGEDGAVRVWRTAPPSAAEGARVEARRFEGHDGAVYAVAFAPDGETVISGGADRRLLANRFDPAAAGTVTETAKRLRDRLAQTEVAFSDPNVRLLGEHDAAVRSLSFAADGATLFSSGNDNTVRVWDLTGGVGDAALARTLRGHGGWVRSCASVGDRVLSCGYDRRVRLWDWRRYSFPLALRSESKAGVGDAGLTCGAASADGRWVATASASGAVTVWDMKDPANPRPQELAEGHTWQATTAAYFPDGRRLLTAGGDNTALVWDVAKGSELTRMGGWNVAKGAGWRGVATVSTDGGMIATGADGDVLARVWDADTGTLLASIPTPEADLRSAVERPEATAMAFASDSRALLVGDQWGALYLADPKAGRAERVGGHEGKVSGIVFLSADEVVTAGADGVATRWSLQGASLRSIATFRHADRVLAIAASDDGGRIVTAAGPADDTTLRLWDVDQSEKPLATVNRTEVAAGLDDEPLVRSIDVHATLDEALLTVYDRGTSTYRVAKWQWNAAPSPYRLVSRRGLRDLSAAVFAPGPTPAILTVGGRGARLYSAAASIAYRPQSAVRSIAFSPKGERLAAAGAGGLLKFWRYSEHRGAWTAEETVTDAHRGAVESVEFAAGDGGRLLTAGADGVARLWSGEQGAWRVEATYSPDGADRQALAHARFLPSADGKAPRVVTVGAGGARVWSAPDTSRPIGDGAAGSRLAASSDGRWLVVAGGAEARVYNAQTLAAVGPPLAGHSSEITSLAITDDGSRLFTTSRDFTTKLWDLASVVDGKGDDATGRELLTLEGHSDEVTSVTVANSPEGPYAMTTGFDGQALVWPTANPR